MFGANGCWAVEKCRIHGGKDNTQEDKKAWNNQNIKNQLGRRYLNDERHKEREGGGFLGSDKKHSEESNYPGMTTVHPNNTIIPCHQG